LLIWIHDGSIRASCPSSAGQRIPVRGRAVMEARRWTAAREGCGRCRGLGPARADHSVYVERCAPRRLSTSAPPSLRARAAMSRCGPSFASPKPRRRKRRSLNLAAAGRDLRHPPLHSRNDCARVRLRRCGHRLRAGAHARSRARCPCDMAAAAAPGAPNLAAPSKIQKVLPATETVT